jgi:hypothetical protein
MNDAPNTTDWKVGDIIIHDVDEKSSKYLMRVTQINRKDGMIGAVYHNRAGNHPLYLNKAKFLHDPARFGIEV